MHEEWGVRARRGDCSLRLEEVVVASSFISSPLRKNVAEEREFAGSSTPHSSSDSLSENANVVTNDFVSEGQTTVSR